jgi:AcrR family transcriptional regulator
MSVNGVRAKQAEATRAKLRRRARRLFATKGYANASTEDLVRTTGLTKGALYHHFGDKEGLFRAVVEDLERELAEVVAQATETEADAWIRLERACKAYLDVSLRPDVARILVLDAPSVLGWHEWCEIDKQYGIAMFDQTLRQAMDGGVLPTQPAETLAQVLLGALNVAARVAATRTEGHDEVWTTVARLLSGLKTPPGLMPEVD